MNRVFSVTCFTKIMDDDVVFVPMPPMNENQALNQQLTSGDAGIRIQALDTLKEALLFENHQYSFNYHANEIMRIIQKQESPVEVEHAVWCLRTAIDADPEAVVTLYNSDSAGILISIIETNTNQAVAEHCIHIIYAMSKRYAGIISVLINFDIWVNLVQDSFASIEKRLLISILMNISIVIAPITFRNVIPKIFLLTNSEDQQISTNSITILLNLAEKTKISEILPEVVSCFCDQLFVTANHEIREHLLKILKQIASDVSHATVIINKQIDFERLLFSESIHNNTSDFQSMVLKLILHLLPDNSNFRQLGVPAHLRSDISTKFVNTIQDLIIRIILEKPLSVQTALLDLAVTLQSQPLEITDDLITALFNLSFSMQNAPYILAILSLYSNDSKVADSGILNILARSEVTKPLSFWYQNLLKDVSLKLRAAQTSTSTLVTDDMTLEQIDTLIEQDKISKIQFLFNKSADRCKILLERHPNPKSLNISNLVKFAYSLLNVITFPHNFGQPSLSEFAEKVRKKHDLLILTKEHGRTVRYISAAPLCQSINYLEGTINADKQYNTEFLVNTMKLFPKYFRYLKFDSTRPFPPAHLSVLNRVFFKDYPKISIQGYSMNDSVLSLYCDKLSGWNMIDNSSPEISINGPLQNIPLLHLRGIQFDYYRSLLELLKTIYIKTGITLENQSFVNRIRDQLAFPANSICRFSFAMTILFQFPFLFPFNMRLLSFKLVNYETFRAIRCLNNEFHLVDNDTIQDKRAEPLKLLVSRNSLFDDGKEILNYYTAHRIPIDVQFEREEGVGQGPTREFFFLLSREFAKVSVGLFRNDKTGSEFCFTDQGLFPAPNANPQLFKLLGILVAKAISMDATIDISFNPVFFELCRGHVVYISQVDPFLDKSLQCTEDLLGLDFEYPGYFVSDFPKMASSVTLQNVDKFIELVRNYTVSMNVKKCAIEFVQGFSAVIPFSMFDVFTPTEIIKIIKGIDEPISTNDLHNYIELNGYTKDSPQIEMLFDIISNMKSEAQHDLIKFLTGSKYLPIGGIKALNPKISINKKDDSKENDPNDYLPTASVCSYILKLPPYSKKEIMYEKLMVAIQNCQDSFELT